MTIEFSVGLENLKKLIVEFSPLGDLSNEAQTRFSFIDTFLKSCLGWSDAGSVRVEVFERGDRTDYECGNPRQLIVEAKKAESAFKFPPRGGKGSFRAKIKSLASFDASLEAALDQAFRYCQSRGVQVAAVSNGPQLVIFVANRVDGIAPLDGDALFFTGYEDLVRGFNLIFEALSPDGLAERRLSSLLAATVATGLPPKLSASCLDYFQYKYNSAFQENVRNAASLVFEDLGKTPELEDQFLRQCYCESGPLTQFAMVGKNLLSARYAALFPSQTVGSVVQDVNPHRTAKTTFKEQALGEALARRPIVLVGDVGIGKSTFLRHLIKVRASSEFNSAVSVHLDLGSRGMLAKSPKEALLDEITRTLKFDYKVNIFDQAIIDSIYRTELEDFESGFQSQLKAIDNAQWTKNRIAYIQSLVDKREEHLRRCLEHVAGTSRRQAIVIIDNSDQRDLAVQQDAFLISNELAAHWKCLVFLALRPQTFHASKRSGAISAYPPKVFAIPPPKLEDVLRKRLKFAHDVAKGTLPVQSVAGLTLHVESLAILISAMTRSLEESKELMEFVVNVSSGNVRLAIELVARFFGSPNVEAERIVQIFKEQGHYTVPLHEFAKVALLGDYAHFQEDASVASNVFSLVYPDPKEHFLSLFILGYLDWDGAEKEHREGFTETAAIVREMQNQGFNVDQVNAHLARLTRKKLIESTERRQLETPEELTEKGFPESFRITTLGAYHLKRWASEFAYLESMAYDTPIMDKGVRDALLQSVNDQLLSARYQRATSFLDYLDRIWITQTHPPYFDWHALRAASQVSFEKARRYLTDRGLAK